MIITVSEWKIRWYIALEDVYFDRQHIVFVVTRILYFRKPKKNSNEIANGIINYYTIGLKNTLFFGYNVSKFKVLWNTFKPKKTYEIFHDYSFAINNVISLKEIDGVDVIFQKITFS